jgi:DNA-damage-inducible protein D
MLKVYDYLETVIAAQQREQSFFESKLNYFASDIMETLNIEDKEEIDLSLERALQVCSALNIPVHFNFKKVYRFDGENLISDWKISSLACYLLIINCSTVNEHVAKAQLYFAINNLAHK